MAKTKQMKVTYTDAGYMAFDCPEYNRISNEINNTLIILGLDLTDIPRDEHGWFSSSDSTVMKELKKDFSDLHKFIIQNVNLKGLKLQIKDRLTIKK